jgi:4-aminobutyrate aminotransferase-like enzyme
MIGSKDIMNQWGPSQGEAIHTDLFRPPGRLRHGVATIQEMKKINLPLLAKETGDYCLQQLNLALSGYPFIGDIRGRG